MNLRTLILTIWLLLIVAMGTALAVVPPLTSLTLAWDKAPSHGTNISYVLKWGPQVGATNFALSVGTNLTAVVTNPTTGFLYFHVVARTPEGLESEPSNTVIQTNYPAKPLELRVTTNTTSSINLEYLNADGWTHLATISFAPYVIEMNRRWSNLRTVQLPPLPK